MAKSGWVHHKMWVAAIGIQGMFLQQGEGLNRRLLVVESVLLMGQRCYNAGGEALLDGVYIRMLQMALDTTREEHIRNVLEITHFLY